jgi:replicative DNA helicase
LSTKTNIFIDDSSPLTLLELRAKARRMKNVHNIDGIIIDYLQLMDVGNDSRVEARHLEIGMISRSLKQLAKELEIPVIALSQLSRKLEDRSGSEKKPQLSDLRESGSIEQDADVVIFISRPELFLKSVEPEDKDYDKIERLKAKQAGLAEILIGKQRNGPAGIKVDLHFEKEYARFIPRERYTKDEPQYYVPPEDQPF